jgi:DNA-binding Lrp family transcriptional regulator
LIKDPYREIAERVGLSERELINIIKSLKERGYIRRFGATLRHREAGFKGNGMVVWNVSDEEIERVGNIMKSFKEVTHSYERPRFGDFKYNLFTMIHGKNKEDIKKIARKISEVTNIDDYRILFSEEEYKKSSMRYF